MHHGIAHAQDEKIGVVEERNKTLLDALHRAENQAFPAHNDGGGEVRRGRSGVCVREHGMIAKILLSPRQASPAAQRQPGRDAGTCITPLHQQIGIAATWSEPARGVKQPADIKKIAAATMVDGIDLLRCLQTLQQKTTRRAQSAIIVHAAVALPCCICLCLCLYPPSDCECACSCARRRA